MVHCYTQLRNFPKGKRTKAGGVDRTAHKQSVLVIRYCLPCCSESLKIPSLFPRPPLSLSDPELRSSGDHLQPTMTTQQSECRTK